MSARPFAIVVQAFDLDVAHLSATVYNSPAVHVLTDFTTTRLDKLVAIRSVA
jgi:hypothetical protein